MSVALSPLGSGPLSAACEVVWLAAPWRVEGEGQEAGLDWERVPGPGRGLLSPTARAGLAERGGVRGLPQASRGGRGRGAGWGRVWKKVRGVKGGGREGIGEVGRGWGEGEGDQPSSTCSAQLVCLTSKATSLP